MFLKRFHLIKKFDEINEDAAWEMLDEDPVAKENRKVIVEAANEMFEGLVHDVTRFFKILLGVGIGK